MNNSINIIIMLYSYISMNTKYKNEGEYRIFNESKNMFIECICETEAF